MKRKLTWQDFFLMWIAQESHQGHPEGCIKDGALFADTAVDALKKGSTR